MPSPAHIRIVGARQNNLRNLSLDLPLGELTVITGVSGSGKSSLAFDTLYAEGQRRYIETFSPYARQFLDRMERPQVDRIEGIPPAIAIDQTNPVRTSRSTVGTMTEINDHLKLLFARAAKLYCQGCGQLVQRDTAASILESIRQRAAALGDPRLLVCFEVARPPNLPDKELRQMLQAQGYVRFVETADKRAKTLTVIQDRFRAGTAESGRTAEALEAALHAGRGRLAVHAVNDADETLAIWRYSSGLHCAECDISYQDPLPSHFSFNSPLGACETCKGFGRVIGIDAGLVIPDHSKSLGNGAIKPWQTPTGKECQDDMERHAPAAHIPMDVPFGKLNAEQLHWVWQGDGKKGRKHWYGIKGYFEYLERKAYKMHVRVLLSRYRSYTECSACRGARLKPQSLLWKLGGYNFHELALLPAHRCRTVFAQVRLPQPFTEADDLLLAEVRARLGFLCDVGLGYLSLDRQSRTLSGGEVQRINLTTALGTSLVNTLFVLDEPSIGLHPRDMARVIGVMRRLRDAGNTLLVVEHDPQIMAEADRIIDMGPGAGEHGGAIVFNGPARDITRCRESLTGDYLAGRRRIDARHAKVQSAQGKEKAQASQLVLTGANLHNVVDARLEVPLGKLVCVTGVSGSGKSTLVTGLLYPALQRALGKGTESAGQYKSLAGSAALSEAVLVDQSPIGRTTRSNPASHVGAFDPVRQLFARVPEARLRGYTPGTFSFNSGTGRCSTCGGNGFEHVEMQLLADVYLKCSTCDGRRYRDEILELRIEGAGRTANIFEVLQMTVTEAVVFFAGEAAVLERLQPLEDVGLGYVRLGQPVPTLSGGEAQRLKLAGHLADASNTGSRLLIFDEPTTGLHFEDIAQLMRAFDKLLDRGHSLLVIEHNLDVIAGSDWLIEMGPEAGEEGGRIVATGTPAHFTSGRIGHTGQALADYQNGIHAVRDQPRTTALAGPESIDVRGAREHNLKDVAVSIPHGAMTVMTGVSGSGKSTLAFDILFNEGQRRYLESLNAYARQFVQPASRPDVDSVTGIPPTVAIEQRASRGGRKSTVATLTEIYPFLRLLYVKLGTQFCPDCHIPVQPLTLDGMVDAVTGAYRNQTIHLFAPLVSARKGHYRELAQWAAAQGHSHLRVDGELASTAKWPKLARYKIHDIELPLGELRIARASEPALRGVLERGLELGKGLVQIQGPADGNELRSFSARRACTNCGKGFADPDPQMFSYNSARGWCTACFGTGLTLEAFDAEQTGEEGAWEEVEGEQVTCPSCEGKRLNETALAVKFRDQSIAQVTELPVARLQGFVQKLKLDAREKAIGQDLLTEITTRLEFLGRVGLSYLGLDRAAPTLSGGETQRLRLAAQLGSNLRGVCYVLDEPTIGLHPRDNLLLLDALTALAGGRNTLVVVEHDEETIRRADHVIDLGPGAGTRGGHVVGSGTVQDLMANPASITGRYLREPLRHPRVPRRPVLLRGRDATPMLSVQGATLHNLQELDVEFPLGRIIAMSGVSGSGKSTLARDVLYAELHGALASREKRKAPAYIPHNCKQLAGLERIERVLEVDQTPIGRTPRSCPATYVGFWDAIRKLFAAASESAIRGYTASRFSFNTAGGRCASCEGQGIRTIGMSFLPEVKVLCDACNGQRFDPETLSIRWRGKSIGDVLGMSVDDAVEFFTSHPAIHHPLVLLQEVGLGYLTLGQQSPTLSGGEAQRIKLVTELARIRRNVDPRANAVMRGSFYVLDEPTVGLHMADVEKLIGVLHRLTDAGHTVLVIEHNLDVIAQSDWVIDLGPEAGAAGGRIVATGTPAQIARNKRSHTGRYLAQFLENRHGA